MEYGLLKKKAFKSKWVYKIKHYSDESINRLKTRLVIFVYYQRQEIVRHIIFVYHHRKEIDYDEPQWHKW